MLKACAAIEKDSNSKLDMILPLVSCIMEPEITDKHDLIKAIQEAKENGVIQTKIISLLERHSFDIQ